MTNFQITHHKKGVYSKLEFFKKSKIREKDNKGLKRNTKPFFRYLKSKNKVKKTVKELVDSDEKTGK